MALMCSTWVALVNVDGLSLMFSIRVVAISANRSISVLYASLRTFSLTLTHGEGAREMEGGKKDKREREREREAEEDERGDKELAYTQLTVSYYYHYPIVLVRPSGVLEHSSLSR